MRRTLWISLAAAAVAFLGPARLNAPRAQGAPGRAEFVVHEWGVLVTSHTPTGIVIGPPAEMASGLPGFVLRHRETYRPPPPEIRVWKKPVLYFYGPEGMELTVTVNTPSGDPVAYWPRPDRFLDRTVRTSGKGELIGDGIVTSLAGGMEWSGTLTARPGRRPTESGPKQWWSTARRVPAAYFNTKDASERFLFYEATAR